MARRWHGDGPGGPSTPLLHSRRRHGGRESVVHPRVQPLGRAIFAPVGMSIGGRRCTRRMARLWRDCGATVAQLWHNALLARTATHPAHCRRTHYYPLHAEPQRRARAERRGKSHVRTGRATLRSRGETHGGLLKLCSIRYCEIVREYLRDAPPQSHAPRPGRDRGARQRDTAEGRGRAARPGPRTIGGAQATPPPTSRAPALT